MRKPLRTGFLFGLGFTLVFGGIGAILGLILDLAERNRNEEAKSIVPVRAEPTILRVEPVLRGGQIVILVSVKNESDHATFFQAEAVIFGVDGNYYDTCPTEELIYLDAGGDHHFKAPCPTYGVDQSETMETLGKVEIQFVRNR